MPQSPSGQRRRCSPSDWFVLFEIEKKRMISFTILLSCVRKKARICFLKMRSEKKFFLEPERKFLRS
ncbi:hypothetical protein HMPREF1553_01152 [Porphyromonas gingivalis F0568]|nr:hypothetical protein HMPREF1553_01152 [Porphyromonas gingivalis F0568]